MKIRLLAPSLVAILALVSLPLGAQAPAPAPAGPAAKGEPKTALEKQMDRINRAVKALRKQISDPARNASSLALLATVQDAAAAATKLSPAKADDYTGAEKAKFIADYQAGMKDFQAGVDKVAASLRADDNAAAAAGLKHLYSLERKDHKQFRRPEKD